MIEVASQSTRWAISSRTSSSPEAEAVSGLSFVPGGLTCIDVSNWWSSSASRWSVLGVFTVLCWSFAAMVVCLSRKGDQRVVAGVGVSEKIELYALRASCPPRWA
ncbi:Uncharacterised protein [Mycobacteroides abscessus subsp. abscessus]|nr:Uncharacterised protein [Mycobacteroides abscessus subsp. abscessus]